MTSPIKQERRDQAATDFPGVATLACCFGFTVRQCTLVHYQLIAPTKLDGWLLNIYPTTRRLYSPKQRQAPYLRYLPNDWQLLDIVKAAIVESVCQFWNIRQDYTAAHAKSRDVVTSKHTSAMAVHFAELHTRARLIEDELRTLMPPNDGHSKGTNIHGECHERDAD